MSEAIHSEPDGTRALSRDVLPIINGDAHNSATIEAPAPVAPAPVAPAASAQMASAQTAQTEEAAPISPVRRLRHDLRTPLNQILGYSEMLLEEAADDSPSRAMIADLNRIHAAGQHLLQLIETRLGEAFAPIAQTADAIRADATRADAIQNPTANAQHQVPARDQNNSQNVVAPLATDIENRKSIVAAATPKRATPADGMPVDGMPVDGMPVDGMPVTASIDASVMSSADVVAQTDVAERIDSAGRTDVRAEAMLERAAASPARSDEQVANAQGRALAGGLVERRRAERLVPERALEVEVAVTPEEKPLREGGLLLVVDDNETNRDLLSRRLERQGHRVQCAEDGRQALEMIAAGSFDVVLLDIMMPHMDGYEVLQRLKENPQTRHVPVIMISALDELQSVVRCIEGGAEDYLPKPFDPVLLRAHRRRPGKKARARPRSPAFRATAKSVHALAGIGNLARRSDEHDRPRSAHAAHVVDGRLANAANGLRNG